MTVIANALSAGFHLIAHRALPRPVGSRDRVTRYRYFIAACSVGKCPRAPDRPRQRVFNDSAAFVEQNDAADLDVVVQERHELAPGILPELGDPRILCTPLGGELSEPFLGGGLGRRGADRPDVAGDLIPVLSGCCRLP